MPTDTLRQYRERIERLLAVRLPANNTPPKRLHEAMRYAVLGGGKRVRACLAYATGRALGIDIDRIDASAGALELIHAYSLVHDDLPCMDDDDLRRGRPTCHKAYDEATALLVGDALQAAAFEWIADDSGLPAVIRVEMVARLARAAGSTGMAGGQAIDLAAVGKPLTLDELQDMHARKTGALIGVAVDLAMLAAMNVDAVRRQALETYATTVGLAFQIADDILDVEGETGMLGKRAGSDHARGKPTYASVLGLDEARAKAQALLGRALESLAPFGDNGGELALLARYIVERRQ